MKRFSKVISIVLCFVMLFAMAVPAFAAENENDVPIVYVKGQGGAIYDADGNELGGYDVDTKAMVKQVLEALADTYITRNYAYAAECLGEVIEEMFPPLDKNGEAAEGEHAPASRYSGKTSDYGYDDYAFVYDWRLDPIYNADLLAQHIDKVLAMTGETKVALVGFSEGSCVCGAYLTYYGADKVDSYTMVSPGCNSIDIVGALAAGECKFNSKTLDKFVTYYVDAGNMLGDDGLEGLLSAFASILAKIKVLGFGADFLQDLYDGINENAAFSDVVLGCYPGFWSFVGDDYYDAAIEKNFGGREAEFSGLIEKINKYHYEVYQTLPDTLVALKNAGLKLSVVAKYGSASFPVIDDIDIQSDGVIELHNTSFGATSAKLGETLSSSYLKNADKKYVSSDNVIDASTCLFKDSTWFVHGINHDSSRGALENFVVSLTKSTVQPTIENVGVSQFLDYDSATDTINDLKADNGSSSMWSGNFFEVLIRFFKKVVSYLKGLFNK